MEVNKYNLPKGFIDVEKAIDSINKYDGKASATEPVLDITAMAGVRKYIEPRHTFRIRFCTFRKDQYGRIKKQSEGSKWVWVEDTYEAASLERAIVNKFRELSGQQLSEERELRAVTSAIDPDDANSGRPRFNKAPVAKIGDVINSTPQTITGENV